MDIELASFPGHEIGCENVWRKILIGGERSLWAFLWLKKLCLFLDLSLTKDIVPVSKELVAEGGFIIIALYAVSAFIVIFLAILVGLYFKKHPHIPEAYRPSLSWINMIYLVIFKHCLWWPITLLMAMGSMYANFFIQTDF